MKKTNLYILLCLGGICFLLSGCQPDSTILFIYKNYSYESIESSPEIEKKINKNCIKNGYNPEFAIVNREGEQSISDIIAETRASLIYIDPLISESPESFAETYPDILFFTLKRNSSATKPPNLLSIHYNRRDIFRDAGIMTAQLLTSLRNAKIKTIKRDKEFKAGMILYPASPAAEAEASEYLKGFSEVCPEDLFIYHEINNITDKVVIQNILDEMKNNGVV
ncbi:MAG: hypothetical protein JXJ04_22055, partial [Spirochaetales bacterium]|nr:hypothetical protein [Spirochaetales bacterium]